LIGSVAAYSSKLAELETLLVRLCAERRKIVVFSEWTTMLDLIEKILRTHRLCWVRLDGSVPQKRRQQIVHEFQRDPDCQLFLTTNAGRDQVAGERSLETTIDMPQVHPRFFLTASQRRIAGSRVIPGNCISVAPSLTGNSVFTPS
jgi:superfamily II DNA/RNA helicase